MIHSWFNLKQFEWEERLKTGDEEMSLSEERRIETDRTVR